MTDDHSGFVVRRPRYMATAEGDVYVQVERAADAASSPLPAQLVDFSRHGLRLRLQHPLQMQEEVTIRLREPQSGLEQCFTARVLWQRQEDDQHWAVGCPFEGQAEWEGLGELFLNRVIEP